MACVEKGAELDGKGANDEAGGAAVEDDDDDDIGSVPSTSCKSMLF